MSPEPEEESACSEQLSEPPPPPPRLKPGSAPECASRLAPVNNCIEFRRFATQFGSLLFTCRGSEVFFFSRVYELLAVLNLNNVAGAVVWNSELYLHSFLSWYMAILMTAIFPIYRLLRVKLTVEIAFGKQRIMIISHLGGCLCFVQSFTILPMSHFKNND